MNRDIASLQSKEFDLLVVGGGIYGACAVWDAAQRGLSVALVEKGDFSQATSANSYKIVHGGIRYLQQGDLRLVCRSSAERSALLRIAPHLVEPLPVVIPTYGHGMKGKEVLRAGFAAYDLLTIGKNRGITDPDRRIPWGRFFSRAEVLELYPELTQERLTGGALMHDGQMYNPPRLAVAFIRSAAAAGACIANYCGVERFVREGDRVVGVEATDFATGENVRIRASVVLNTTGPWADALLKSGLEEPPEQKPPSFSRDVALVLDRPYPHRYGLACSAETKDAKALVDRGGRHLFFLPWRESSLIGVWHKVFKGSPDDITVSSEEIEEFLREANDAYPGLRASVDEVSTVITGLILFGDEDQDETAHNFAKRSWLVDHAKQHGLDGLITQIGVRATTARKSAADVVDLALRKLGRQPVACRTDTTPIWGGAIPAVGALTQEVLEAHPDLDARALRSVVRNYGSEFQRVLAYGESEPELLSPLGDSSVLRAEVIHAVSEEMALTLQDIVLRRTDLGTAVGPTDEALSECAALLARELGWDSERTEAEIEATRRFFEHRGARRQFPVTSG